MSASAVDWRAGLRRITSSNKWVVEDLTRSICCCFDPPLLVAKAESMARSESTSGTHDAISFFTITSTRDESRPFSMRLQKASTR